MQKLKDLIDQIEKAVQEDEPLDAYVSSLQDRVSEVGKAAIDIPSQESISTWLRLYAHLSPLAIEYPAEITLLLYENHSAAFNASKKTLSGPEQKIIDEFVSSLTGC